MDFELKSDFKPTGDQPQAIKSIVSSINNNEKYSTLLGVTGSGKTFKMCIRDREYTDNVIVLDKNSKSTLYIGEYMQGEAYRS